jgi:hypothetical protein
MNNQQQVDKKRHGSKIMRSKSLNVTATSLIFPLFAKFRSEQKKEKERESGTRTNGERERERERKREKE